jgi:hypothetical protein
MSLPQQPDRDTFSGPDLEAYDAVLERRRRVQADTTHASAYYGALLNSPPAAAVG